VTAVIQENRQYKMPRAEFLRGVNNTAIYALTGGVPGFIRHLGFLVSYVDEWLKRYPEELNAASEALPLWVTPRTLKLLQRIPRRGRQLLLQALLIAPLLATVPWLYFLSAFKSAWGILRMGVRGIPPLITSVVVVFVTRDGWQLLGAGFTNRFYVLVTVFLAASVIFLIRKDCWADLETDELEATPLLADIRRSTLWAVIEKVLRRMRINGIADWVEAQRKRPFAFRQLVLYGAQPLPMVRPASRCYAFLVWVGYLILSAFALLVTAGLVAVALIVVGVIAINREQTSTLASAVHVYQTFPGNVVVTEQLLSLSVSLGALAAFILVATQRPEDRAAFIKNIIARYRRALLVYSIYCRAHDQAENWTGIPVKSQLCQRGGTAAWLVPAEAPAAGHDGQQETPLPNIMKAQN